MVQVIQCVMSQDACTSSVHYVLPGHYLHTRQLEIICSVLYCRYAAGSGSR